MSAEEDDHKAAMAAMEVVAVAHTVKVPLNHLQAVGDMERNK